MPLPAIAAAAGQALLPVAKEAGKQLAINAVLGGGKGSGGSTQGNPALSRSQSSGSGNSSIGQLPQGQKNLPFGI